MWRKLKEAIDETYDYVVDSIFSFCGKKRCRPSPSTLTKKIKEENHLFWLKRLNLKRIEEEELQKKVKTIYSKKQNKSTSNYYRVKDEQCTKVDLLKKRDRASENKNPNNKFTKKATITISKGFVPYKKLNSNLEEKKTVTIKETKIYFPKKKVEVLDVKHDKDEFESPSRTKRQEKELQSSNKTCKHQQYTLNIEPKDIFLYISREYEILESHGKLLYSADLKTQKSFFDLKKVSSQISDIIAKYDSDEDKAQIISNFLQMCYKKGLFSSLAVESYFSTQLDHEVKRNQIFNKCLEKYLYLDKETKITDSVTNDLIKDDDGTALVENSVFTSNDYVDLDNQSNCRRLFNELAKLTTVKENGKNFPSIEKKEFDFLYSIVYEGNEALYTHLLCSSDVSLKSMKTLRRGKWLNDEIVNFFTKLVVSKYSEVTGTVVVSTFFYTLLFEARKKGEYAFKKFEKMFRNYGVNSSCQKLLIPINHSGHWSLMSLELEKVRLNSEKDFEIEEFYYDSLYAEEKGKIHSEVLSDFLKEYFNKIYGIEQQSINNENVSNGLNKILKESKNIEIINLDDDEEDSNNENQENKDISTSKSVINSSDSFSCEIIQKGYDTQTPIWESKNKRAPQAQDEKIEINTQSSSNVNFLSKSSLSSRNPTVTIKLKIAQVPKQTNTNDCGVFMCKFIEYLFRNEQFNFSQDDMLYFRQIIGLSIIRNELYTESPWNFHEIRVPNSP